MDKIRNRCEVTVVGEGLHLAASEQTNDMYAAIDLVYDKLESQIKKYVSRVKEQRRQARNATIDVFTYNLEAEAPEEQENIGTDRFNPKPMPVEEAMMQLDSIGSDFFVFLNADNGRINVKRGITLQRAHGAHEPFCARGRKKLPENKGGQPWTSPLLPQDPRKTKRMPKPRRPRLWGKAQLFPPALRPGPCPRRARAADCV